MNRSHYSFRIHDKGLNGTQAGGHTWSMWGLTIMASRQVGVLALFHARAEIVRIGKRVDSPTPYCYPVNVDIRHSDIESKKPSGSTGDDGNG